jgi:hypothetical protein
MGRGFQVWKFHLKISPWEEKPCLPRAYGPWEARFSSRGLIFGGEDFNEVKKFPYLKLYPFGNPIFLLLNLRFWAFYEVRKNNFPNGGISK